MRTDPMPSMTPPCSASIGPPGGHEGLLRFDHLPPDAPPPDEDPPPGHDRPDDDDPIHPHPDEIRRSHRGVGAGREAFTAALSIRARTAVQAARR